MMKDVPEMNGGILNPNMKIGEIAIIPIETNLKEAFSRKHIPMGIIWYRTVLYFKLIAKARTSSQTEQSDTSEYKACFSENVLGND